MSGQFAYHDEIPADDFVDRANRRLPIRDQAACDRAAREIGRRSPGDPLRIRLAELAGVGGFLLPIGFAPEVDERLERVDPATFGGGSGKRPITLKAARIHAQTEEGRALLRRRGLKPSPEDYHDGPSGLATFGAERRPSMNESRRNTLLASTEHGRAILRRRGYRPSEVVGLQAKSLGS